MTTHSADFLQIRLYTQVFQQTLDMSLTGHTHASIAGLSWNPQEEDPARTLLCCHTSEGL